MLLVWNLAFTVLQILSLCVVGSWPLLAMYFFTAHRLDPLVVTLMVVWLIFLSCWFTGMFHWAVCVRWTGFLLAIFFCFGPATSLLKEGLRQAALVLVMSPVVAFIGGDLGDRSRRKDLNEERRDKQREEELVSSTDDAEQRQ